MTFLRLQKQRPRNHHCKPEGLNPLCTQQERKHYSELTALLSEQRMPSSQESRQPTRASHQAACPSHPSPASPSLKAGPSRGTSADHSDQLHHHTMLNAGSQRKESPAPICIVGQPIKNKQKAVTSLRGCFRKRNKQNPKSIQTMLYSLCNSFYG